MLGPEAVAVRAHNVTLCDLAQEGFFGLQLALTGESERLRGGVSMVEVHHVRRKASTTISTRHPPQAVENIRRRTLAGRNSADLCLSVRRVVLSVVRTLLLDRPGHPVL